MQKIFRIKKFSLRKSNRIVKNNTGCGYFDKLKEAFRKTNQIKYTEMNRHKRLRFPWWFKIISFLLSYILMAVSVFIVLYKSFEFGDQRVGKWLASTIIGFFCSIILIQPMEVNKTRFFFSPFYSFTTYAHNKAN